jgi:hypothetical protein
MGQNSDINNIFNSYRNNVLLNEAVKSVEVNEPAKPLTPEEKSFKERAASYGKNWTDAQARIMFARQQEVDKKNGTNYANQPESQKQQQAAPQPAPQPAQQAAQQPVAPQPAPQPTPQQPAQTEADDESGYEEVETTTQVVPNAVQTQPLATSDDGSSYTVDQIKQMIDGLKMEPLAASDSEMSNDQNDEEKEDEDSGWEEVGTPEKENVTSQAKTISTVAEKYNIAKFLKCLSEKNYSLANKYLSNIIKNKVKSKISGEIK